MTTRSRWLLWMNLMAAASASAGPLPPVEANLTYAPEVPPELGDASFYYKTEVKPQLAGTPLETCPDHIQWPEPVTMIERPSTELLMVVSPILKGRPTERGRPCVSGDEVAHELMVVGSDFLSEDAQ